MTDNIEWLNQPAVALNTAAVENAKARQAILTKPPGSLGYLEDLALAFSGWQKTDRPTLDKILIRVFAGDHGVCNRGISAFPQEVTGQMVMNFIHGGAAISVLAENLGADFMVVNMGTVSPIEDAPKLHNYQLAHGTYDFCEQAAMSQDVVNRALNAGRLQVNESNAQLFIGGDMGIGNTTSASAIYSAVLNLGPERTVGPGTGVNNQGLITKQTTIQHALALHSDDLVDTYQILRHLGGLEIAGLVGAYIAAAQNGIPILVDGFISTAAALLAVELNQSVRDWMLFAHRSAEPAHTKALQHLEARAILDLGMRLGEGSGAAIATPLLISALELHNKMATFESAGVSDA